VQVAHVLAVVANAIQVKVVAGVKTTNAQAVKARVGRAADVGNTAQGFANAVDAVIEDVSGFYRVDGLWHIARRG